MIELSLKGFLRMTVPSSRNYFAQRFGLPTDVVSAKRHLKENPSLLDDKMFYIGLYNSVMDNDLGWVKMIVENGKKHLPPERRKGMLSFSGWLQSAIANEYECMIDYLLYELLDHGVDESNFDELLVYSVNHSEHKVIQALLQYGPQNFDARDTYFEACCAATEYDDAVMYRQILPLVVSNDWNELETFLLERSLVKEHQIFEEHKSVLQRQLLQDHLTGGMDDTPRKI